MKLEQNAFVFFTLLVLVIELKNRKRIRSVHQFVDGEACRLCSLANFGGQGSSNAAMYSYSFTRILNIGPSRAESKGNLKSLPIIVSITFNVRFTDCRVL